MRDCLVPIRHAYCLPQSDQQSQVIENFLLVPAVTLELPQGVSMFELSFLGLMYSFLRHKETRFLSRIATPERDGRRGSRSLTLRATFYCTKLLWN